MKRWTVRLAKVFIGVVLFLLLFAGGVELYKATQGNFHTVTDNELYRSAQLSKWQFEHYIQEKGIKTIINLQGKREGEWYDDELNVSNELGVKHYDFKMSAYAFYDANVSKKIIQIMKDAPKPILIHCHGGADRSALVSALWLYAVKNRSAEEAREQFKLLYGYFPYLMWDKKKNMRRSFEDYFNEVNGK